MCPRPHRLSSQGAFARRVSVRAAPPMEGVPMLQLFLFLHVMGAIAVFGPMFVFPVIASQAQKSPQNGPFAAVLSEYIERRIVLPGAVVQGITGVALIIILGADLTSPSYR